MSAATRVLGEAFTAIGVGRIARAEGALHRGRELFTEREWAVVLAALARLELAAARKAGERRQMLAEARGVIAALVRYRLAAEPSPERMKAPTAERPAPLDNVIPWATVRSRIALRAGGAP